MAELNSKRLKKDSDDEDRFQEVSIPFNLPQESEKNYEKEEFKEVSVSLKVSDTEVIAQSSRPRRKRPKPSTSREEEQTFTCSPAAYETGIETDQAETDDDFVETDFNIAHSSDTIDEEYAQIETSLFRSLLTADYSKIIESPEESSKKNEIPDCMWDEINADVLPLENDDPLNDDEDMYELEEFDHELTINPESEEQPFPMPSKSISGTSHSTNDEQYVCNKSQLTVPAMMTLLALFTVKYHLPGEAVAHLLTLLSLARTCWSQIAIYTEEFQSLFSKFKQSIQFSLLLLFLLGTSKW